MAKVLLICGKICSGKSYYVKELRKGISAAVLSCDELMLSLFPQGLGEKHDEIVASVQRYINHKAVEIVRAGANVIIDSGFWSKEDRTRVSEFFNTNQIETEWHYVDISDADWKRNIEERNKAVLAGKSKDYYMDDGLLNKLNSRFEAPKREEIDVWYVNSR